MLMLSVMSLDGFVSELLFQIGVVGIASCNRRAAHSETVFATIMDASLAKITVGGNLHIGGANC